MSGNSGDDDPSLFREAMRDARPLATRARGTGPRRPPARARVRSQEERLLEFAEARTAGTRPEPEVDSHEPLSYRTPGTAESLLRRLRRGELPCEAELDLHGLTEAQARAALIGFIDGAAGRGLSCVRVIHGKGLRSGSRGPVLKRVANTTLRLMPQVRAFVSAPAREGGAGAVRVMLAAAGLKHRR